MTSEPCIPKDAEKNKFTCLVYDDDDFSEESRNQIHILGGIIIQREEQSRNVVVGDMQNKKKGGRTLQAPAKAIVPFSLGKKKAPNFSEASISMDERSHLKHPDLAKRLNFAYILLQMHQCQPNVLPGWTGFNILLRKSMPPFSRIRYLRIVDGSPSEYPTLYTLRCCRASTLLISSHWN